MKFSSVFFVLFMLLNFSVNAQNDSPQKWPVRILLMDESMSFPNFWFTRYDFNPAIMVGTEYLLKEGRKSDLFLAGNLGGYYHKYWRTGIFLNMEFGYRYHFQRFNIAAQLGIGYSHVFSTLPVYKFEGDDYEKVTDLGSPAFMPSIALNAGYALNNKPNSPEVVLTWMFAADDPFAALPIPHHFVGVGIKFYPFNR